MSILVIAAVITLYAFPGLPELPDQWPENDHQVDYPSPGVGITQPETSDGPESADVPVDQSDNDKNSLFDYPEQEDVIDQQLELEHAIRQDPARIDALDQDISPLVGTTYGKPNGSSDELLYSGYITVDGISANSQVPELQIEPQFFNSELVPVDYATYLQMLEDDFDFSNYILKPEYLGQPECLAINLSQSPWLGTDYPRYYADPATNIGQLVDENRDVLKQQHLHEQQFNVVEQVLPIKSPAVAQNSKAILQQILMNPQNPYQPLELPRQAQPAWPTQPMLQPRWPTQSTLPPQPMLLPLQPTPPPQQALPTQTTVLAEPARVENETHVKRPYRTRAVTNKRHDNIENFDPMRYYKPISRIPDSWGSLGLDGGHSFRYNEFGELTSGAKFSAPQIEDYLYQHPLNFWNSAKHAQDSKLILWVQVAPADAAKRYPNERSPKCRFAECPVPNYTIHKGHYRLAFDELSATGIQANPYHCAGFVHLWCMEKFCDFPRICKDLNVQPDERYLPEGKNKMAVTRDHAEMSQVVWTFSQNSQTMTNYDYGQTLCYQLNATHLELQPQQRAEIRDGRGGNHIGLHKGDLEKFVPGERQKWAVKKRPKSRRTLRTDSTKGKSLEEEEGSEIDAEACHSRPTKRARLSR